MPVLVGTGYFRNGNPCYSSSVSSVQVNERGTDFSVGFFLFFFFSLQSCDFIDFLIFC